MRLPNFLVVGAQKAGTSSLHDILDKHPDTSMSKVKEINFFTDETKFTKGLEYYSSYFQKDNSSMVGESSPGYLCYPEVPERIKESLGNIKIIILLRNPIKRAFSQYWDNRRQLNEWKSTSRIVDDHLDTHYIPGKRGYFSRGVYEPQVRKYFELFGESNVKVIIFEELIQNQKQQLFELYQFLGLNVSKGLSTLPPASNRAEMWDNEYYRFFFRNHELCRFLPKRGKSILFFGDKKKLEYDLPSSEIYNHLINFYYPYNCNLEKLLNRKLPW